MTQSIKSYNEAVAFHGHACPGLALGYRAAAYAMDALRAGRSDDEDLVCIVENDACGVDAIQLVAGCSVGKGNLILQDFGKHAYTFIDRKYNRAIRLVQSPEPVVQRIDPVASALREKVMGGTATPAEHKEFHERQAAVIDKILKMPIRGIVHYQRSQAGDSRAGKDLRIRPVCEMWRDGCRAPGPGPGREVCLHALCRGIRQRVVKKRNFKRYIVCRNGTRDISCE